MDIGACVVETLRGAEERGFPIRKQVAYDDPEEFPNAYSNVHLIKSEMRSQMEI